MLVNEIRFPEIGSVEVASVPESPAPGAGEVLLAPSWIGICGSDLHVFHGRHPFVKPPVVTGHEVSARVLATADGVTGLPAGQRVLVNPLAHCGRCAACRRGALNSCEDAKVHGFKLPGLARTRVTVPASRLHPIPEHVPADLACLAEPLATAVHAVDRAGDLDELLIVGGGPIGQCVLLAARAAGAERVVLVEPVPAKRELARRLGADRAIDPAELPDGRRFTAVLDCVAGPETLRKAVDVTAGGGRVVTVGVPGEQAPRLPLPRMQRFEIDLLGSGMYLPRDIDAAIELIAGEHVEAGPLISARYRLDDVPAAFRAAGQPETVKILIQLADRPQGVHNGQQGR